MAHVIIGEKLCDVLLVTGHKSKGLEWENVSLADDFSELFDEHRVPFKVSTDLLPKDEVNLLYVASTRAKRALRLNSELRSLMSWTPQNEACDLTDQKQCEEEFLDEQKET